MRTILNVPPLVPVPATLSVAENFVDCNLTKSHHYNPTRRHSTMSYVIPIDLRKLTKLRWVSTETAADQRPAFQAFA